MPLLEKHLVVRTSTLPASGKGLFTTVFIPKNTRIVEYRGRITTWKDVNHRHGSNGYIYYINRNHVIDALPYKKALARFANDASGLSRVKGIRNNADYEEDGLRVFIQARRNIHPGEEILVSYGKEYWGIIRYNNNLQKKK